MEYDVDRLYKESISESIQKVTNELIKSGILEKNTIVDTDIYLSFFVDDFIKGQLKVSGIIEDKREIVK